MENITSQVLSRALESVQAPINHFIETGFWNPHAHNPDGYEPGDVGDTQVRKICRAVAQELKRPFIICHPTFSYGRSVPDENRKGFYKWEPLDKPEFAGGYVSVPKQKRLTPLVATLILASSADMSLHQRAAPKSPLASYGRETLWEFRIADKTMWDEYYGYVLNDPDCRKARRLTS
jgi:hypothetical protein